MLEVMIDASKIKVEISNMVSTAFILNSSGRACIIHMYPF